MEFSLYTGKKSINILFFIETHQPEIIHIKIVGSNYMNYGEKIKLVKLKKKIGFSLPSSPDHIIVQIYNQKNGNMLMTKDKSFGVLFKIEPLDG